MARKARGYGSLLGERIAIALKRMRQTKGLTQAQVAKTAGLAQSTIVMVEKAQNMHLPTLERVSEAVGWRFEELVAFTLDSGKANIVKETTRP